MIPAQVASRRTDVDDISLAQLSPVWDSVADDFIDGPDPEREPTVALRDTRKTHVQTDFGNPR